MKLSCGLLEDHPTHVSFPLVFYAKHLQQNIIIIILHILLPHHFDSFLLPCIQLQFFHFFNSTSATVVLQTHFWHKDRGSGWMQRHGVLPPRTVLARACLSLALALGPRPSTGLCVGLLHLGPRAATLVRPQARKAPEAVKIASARRANTNGKHKRMVGTYI